MGMTYKQAIEIIKKYDVFGCGYCHQGGKEIEEAFNMAIKALDTWDKIFTSYDNLVAKIESEDDISHATERIDEWCVEQLRSVIGDYYADRIIKELGIDPYQTNMNNAWEQADGDLISREAVIDIIEDVCPIYGNDYRYILREKINELPSVTIPNKVGHWENIKESVGIYKYRCDQCGAYHRAIYDYCPSCGAKMEG